MRYLLAVAWAGVVLGVAAPAPRGRHPGLPAPRFPATGESSGGRRGLHPALVLGRAGRLLRSLAGRPSDAVADRRAGAALAAGVAFVPVLWPLAAPAAAVVWWAPVVAARQGARRRAAIVAAELPETVDLLRLATGAGLGVIGAVEAVARHGHGQLAAALGQAAFERQQGRRLADALDDVSRRAGAPVAPLIAVLTAADRHGAPLAAALDRLAAESRRDLARQAEAAARRVPVKLLFPLVVCILPAFGLLTLAPLIVSALRTLHLPLPPP